MEDLIGLVAVVSIFILLPGMVLIYSERRRRWQQEHAGTPAANADLSAQAERMERRIEALEQILDVESPGWRKKHHEHS